MTYIKKISMSGFKSFGDRTVTIKLLNGFNCVVGPNGAGKSNIIDALCFALGRLSKKTMRAKSLEDLIFAGSKGKNPSTRATVSITFDNSEKVFPGEEDFVITRTIKKGGGGGYRMNGEKVTRQQILNTLAAANVDPDGENQFVLQGKIVELTHMNPEDRRIFIENLIGLQKYDEMKDATLKELDKAERDLGQFEAIFKEVSAQLKKVEKEKSDALAWMELDDKIKSYNAQLIALKISKLKKEENDIEKKIEESTKIIEEIKEKITREEDVLKQETLVMDNIQKYISEKEKEREEINEKITELKTEMSSNQTTLSLAKKSIEKLEQDIKQFESLQMKLEEEQTYDSLIQDVSKEIADYENQIESAKKEIEKRQQNQAEFDVKIQSNEDENTTFKAEISKVKQNISSNNAQIKVLQTNIKKNEDKKKKLENELKKLKGKAESIEEAYEETKKLESDIRINIENLKVKTSEENLNQKDLENKINALQEEKNKLNSKLSDLQSTSSSLNTEIKMNKDNVQTLKDKKVLIENKIKELSKGKSTEDALKALLNKKETMNKSINDLKNRLKEEDSKYRKDEQNLELLKLKQNSVDTEINDNKGKITNINTELKLFTKELTGLQREKQNLELDINTLKTNVSNTDKEIDSLSDKKENTKRRLDELLKEKESKVQKIENSEQEYEKNKEDIQGILQILNMLTQNINVSVETIKSNIQQSNAEAITKSGDDFRKFVLDIVDIMKTVENVNNEAEQASEVSQTLNSILQTLNLFTDNVDPTLSQLINKVKESADIAVSESTSNFDKFIQDLMEILENIHISLKQLVMSKSQELYKESDEISKNIEKQEEARNEIDKKLTEINFQKKHDLENLSKFNIRLEEVDRRLKELHEKTQTYEKEIEKRTNIIKTEEVEAETLKQDVKNLKDIKDKYWENASKIQAEIDKIQVELDKNQENLQELQGIQTLFENIKEIEKNEQDLTKTIEQKNDIIINIGSSIEKVQSDQNILQSDIDQTVIEKAKFWENTENLRNQMDEKSKELETTMDRMRALDNVKRIINLIDELAKENVEANENVEICHKNIETFNLDVDTIQKNVDDKQKVIESLREDKVKEVEAQKEAQKSLNKLNKDLLLLQGKLNELHKNKEREQQIFALSEEIKNTEKQVESTIKGKAVIESELISENNKKDLKQGEIDKLTQDKDESWNKQKQYQKDLANLKSDLSLESSKVNNYESKKLICTDQINTLYQRSKEYGSLPPVTETLTEEGLLLDITDSTNKKKALEPVNLKAIEQYNAVKERFDEIDMRRQTIQRERKAILDSIEKIELEKTRTFMKAYHEINRVFSAIFQKLSPGGSAKMILDRPDNVFSGGISIEARPRGKKISSLEILSGGEKTLVALSFIFAVQEFYPAPFYVMDEIDAALDAPNVHRVSVVIKEFSDQAQFIVISHREENIINADRIYGVSMQQSGITDIFSVDLEEEAKKILELEDVKPEIEDD